MIGPVVKIDPGRPAAARRTSIGSAASATPSCPHYLAGWDVGMMPFAINESTRFISPTKTPEFLAAGVPVVSTPILDVVRPYGETGLVEIADDAPRPSRSGRAAAGDADGADWLARGRPAPRRPVLGQDLGGDAPARCGDVAPRRRRAHSRSAGSHGGAANASDVSIG